MSPGHAFLAYLKSLGLLGFSSDKTVKRQCFATSVVRQRLCFSPTSYVALNPARVIDPSDLKRIQRALEEDRMGAGMVLPQYFPIRGSVSVEPSRTWETQPGESNTNNVTRTQRYRYTHHS